MKDNNQYIIYLFFSHLIVTWATRLAQLVERRTFNPVVVGSSPTSGDHFCHSFLQKNTHFLKPV
jgi:hypothetical protein